MVDRYSWRFLLLIIYFLEFSIANYQNVPLRVHYSDDLFDRLFSAIRNQEMSVPDRAGLLIDATSLIRSGEMNPVTLIRLISSFRGESDAVGNL